MRNVLLFVCLLATVAFLATASKLVIKSQQVSTWVDTHTKPESLPPSHPPIIDGYGGIPIIEIPYFRTSVVKPGWEERSPEFLKWLNTGVRIGGGSGTMSYYDAEGNWMYVISCGHLFEVGYKSAERYRNTPRATTIEVFYHNDRKLPEVRSYRAEVLCHVWENSIHDVSLLRFHPDWKLPWVSPVVPMDYQLTVGTGYHNVGCDGRTEVAHYLVKYFKSSERYGVEEIIGHENVARGGRSGGGLLTDDSQLIGITSRSDRKNVTYYTSFKQIHNFLNKEGFGFVLKGASSPARFIPIRDRNNPQGVYPPDYIPLPGR